MTRAETVALMGRLRAAYPAFCRGLQGDSLRPVVDVWADLLADSSAGRMADAVRLYIRDNKYPPTIAELFEAEKSAAMLKQSQEWMLAPPVYQRAGRDGEPAPADTGDAAP